MALEYKNKKKTDQQLPQTTALSDERNIVLTLDTSGSMDGTPIQETVKAANKFVDTVLEEDASIGIVTYESSAHCISEFSVLRARYTFYSLPVHRATPNENQSSSDYRNGSFPVHLLYTR